MSQSIGLIRIGLRAREGQLELHAAREIQAPKILVATRIADRYLPCGDVKHNDALFIHA